jgi:hypothetical protein
MTAATAATAHGWVTVRSTANPTRKPRPGQLVVGMSQGDTQASTGTSLAGSGVEP